MHRTDILTIWLRYAYARVTSVWRIYYEFVSGERDDSLATLMGFLCGRARRPATLLFGERPCDAALCRVAKGFQGGPSFAYLFRAVSHCPDFQALPGQAFLDRLAWTGSRPRARESHLERVVVEEAASLD